MQRKTLSPKVKRMLNTDTESSKKRLADVAGRMGAAGAIMVLAFLSGCAGVASGSFTTKAYRLEQQGKSAYLDRRVRDIERMRERGDDFTADLAEEDLFGIDVLEIEDKKE